MKIRLIFVLLGLLLATQSIAQPITVELVADRDNTLYESDAGNMSSGVGPTIFSGIVARGSARTRRALLHFDLSQIPSNAVITEVSLQLNVTRTVSGNSTFNLHETLADWGESGSNAGFTGGNGAAAQEGDATWTDRFFEQEMTWVNTGGDFNPNPVSSTALGAVGAYSFPSSTAFVDLANRWLFDSSTNLGLLLRSIESNSTDAKQIASRENPNTDIRPTLTLVYELLESEPIPVSGVWFDSALPGDGFNVVQSPAGLFVFYFGYAGGQGGQRWLISEIFDGPVVTGQDIVINMLFGESGTLTTPQDPATLTTWGTVTINLTDPDNGTFTLSGVDGDKTFQATKLAGVVIAEPEG